MKVVLMANWCVNNSGHSINVYDGVWGNVIGQLYSKEIYIFVDNYQDNWHTIYFKDPLMYFPRFGYVNEFDFTYGFVQFNELPAGTIDGYSKLNVKRDTNVYNSSGSLITTLHAARAGYVLVADDCTCGSSHKEYCYIHGYCDYVNGNPDPTWEYGFVDTGVKVSSTSPSVRGNW